MKNSEILRAAKALLTPETWIQGAFAQNADGDDLDDGFEEGAVCWCARGAVEKVTGTHHEVEYELEGAPERLFGCPVAAANDANETTLADVHRLFDVAIAAAEAREP